jgi:dihydrolipoamide dehydrogenase
MAEKFDLVVVGGGRAANLAIAAGKKGLKTALIERDKLGGTCPNRGCVPSKLLIGFAEAARQVKDANRHFVKADFKDVDLSKIFASVNEYVSAVDARYASRLPDKVKLFRGEGAFVGHKRVQVDGRILEADNIVIATGSRPRPAPFPDLPVWTSDDLFPLQDALPSSLLVIGSGFIGCEMASFFSAVGVKTTILARGPRLLSREDEEIEDVFQTEFSRGVNTILHAQLTDLYHDGSAFVATIDAGGESKMLNVDKVLFATGRVPNTEYLNLEASGLSTDDRGFIAVNDELETPVSGIFAAGDVNGRYMLQHAASFETHYLQRKLLKGIPGPINEGHIAHAVYAYPEVASVGWTEQVLKDSGRPYIAVYEDWLNSARAMSKRITYPRIKLLVSPDDYRILGCHLVGPESDTLIHQVLAVMRLKNDVRELTEMVYIHPAMNECILAAAVKAVGKVRAYHA